MMPSTAELTFLIQRTALIQCSQHNVAIRIEIVGAGVPILTRRRNGQIACTESGQRGAAGAGRSLLPSVARSAHPFSGFILLEATWPSNGMIREFVKTGSNTQRRTALSAGH
jgi:hypothetical protein